MQDNMPPEIDMDPKRPPGQKQTRRHMKTARSSSAGWKALGRFLLKLAIVAVAAWALLTYVLGVFVLHTNDMYPTLRDGDLCITYRLSKPARGDIVAYTAGGVRRFGRIVGLPGDVVDINSEGYFTVNESVPYETIYYLTIPDPDSALAYPYAVPENTVFVLNDYRDSFQDSRRFGAVPLSDVDGSAALLLRHRSW